MSHRRSPPPIDPELDTLNLDLDDLHPSIPLKKVGDLDRLQTFIEGSANVNLRDRCDSVALYYACLASHFEAASVVCSERTFNGDIEKFSAFKLLDEMLKQNLSY